MTKLAHHTQVAFHHTDAAGIVHFANYFLFAEEAETRALATLGLPGPAQGAFYPRVHVSATYTAPLHFSDPITIIPSLTRIGNSSLHWQFLIDGPRGTAATVTAIAARRDAANPPLPFTPKEKELLAPLLPTPIPPATASPPTPS